jgi:hypothetical protein
MLLVGTNPALFALNDERSNLSHYLQPVNMNVLPVAQNCFQLMFRQISSRFEESINVLVLYLPVAERVM